MARRPFSCARFAIERHAATDSSVPTPWSLAIGLSFTGVTVIETVAGFVLRQKLGDIDFDLKQIADGILILRAREASHPGDIPRFGIFLSQFIEILGDRFDRFLILTL